jgi:Fic family protein
MNRPPQGRYQTASTAGEAFSAFIPTPLPPQPPIDWTPALRKRFDDALLAVGRLDAVTDLLPNANLLLYGFVRKEAVLSSMIEGTQSSLADLMLHELGEAPGVPLADVREVSQCVAAIDHGLARLREGFPLSMRLLREVHGVLLSHGRGAQHSPGEFRRSQVWIGGTRPGNAMFVPPPAHEVPEQFETIHPFLDGNGRVGRLLITLQLCADGLLREPLLYLSLHFKTHRRRYYELLNAVRDTGNWEAWLDFFAEAVQVSATQATTTARRLVDLCTADRARIQGLGRAATSALAVFDVLQHRPIATAASLVAATCLTAATVNKALAHLETLGVVTERSGRRRDRVFGYARYVEVLNEGAALPEP